MIDGQVALQEAIAVAVKTSSDLAPLIAGRIYDDVPPKPVFPYASFGGFETFGLGGTCDAGVEIDVQIDTWSRAVGSLESKAVGAALLRLMTSGSVAPEGFKVGFVRPLFLRSQRGLDGRTTQSILKLRFALTPTA